MTATFLAAALTGSALADTIQLVRNITDCRVGAIREFDHVGLAEQDGPCVVQPADYYFLSQELPIVRDRPRHSHSIVAGGFPEIS
jgi:hypothetical protein